MHHPIGPEVQIFFVGDEGHLEGPGILQGPAHEHGVHHRVAVVGEGHRPGGLLVAVFAQGLAQGAHGDGAHGVDPGESRRPGRLEDEAGDRSVVVHRAGVGHGGHRGEAAGHRGPGPRQDGLLVLFPRLPQVDVHVDEAGGHHQVLGGNHPAPLGGDGSGGLQSGNLAPFDQEVPGFRKLLGGVNHQTALYQ